MTVVKPGSAASVLADRNMSMLWSAKGLKVLSSRRPVVLIYHSIAPGPGDYFGPDVLERHVGFLTSRFHIVGPDESCRIRSRGEDIDVVLTFDDGFLNNAVHVVPILRRYQVPAIFFVSTRHCDGRGPLWFVYLKAFSRWFSERDLALDGIAYNLSPGSRQRSLLRLRNYLLSLRPHPQAMYERIERCLPSIESFAPRDYLEDHYAGMTWDHIREIGADPLFEVGIHTVDHPLLTLCDEGEMERQIRTNREQLERAVGKPVRSIAYPSGDYDCSVVAKCREMEVGPRYAVELKRGIRGNTANRGDIPRVGVYRPSLSILGFKVQWGNFLRRTPLRFG